MAHSNLVTANAASSLFQAPQLRRRWVVVVTAHPHRSLLNVTQCCQQHHIHIKSITSLLPKHPGLLSSHLLHLAPVLPQRTELLRHHSSTDLCCDLTCTVCLLLPFFFSHIFWLQVLQGQEYFAH